MQAPKRKTSKSVRNMRRSHHALTPVYQLTCPKCKEPVLRHHVCMSCGYYRGKQLINVESEAQ